MCWKLTVPSYTGVPDRLILLPGEIVRFVETKRPGEKERARQEYVHSLLRRMGFTVYSTVDSPEKVRANIEECREAVHGKGL